MPETMVAPSEETASANPLASAKTALERLSFINVAKDGREKDKIIITLPSAGSDLHEGMKMLMEAQGIKDDTNCCLVHGLREADPKLVITLNNQRARDALVASGLVDAWLFDEERLNRMASGIGIV